MIFWFIAALALALAIVFAALSAWALVNQKRIFKYLMYSTFVYAWDNDQAAELAAQNALVVIDPNAYPYLSVCFDNLEIFVLELGELKQSKRVREISLFMSGLTPVTDRQIKIAYSIHLKEELSSISQELLDALNRPNPNVFFNASSKLVLEAKSIDQILVDSKSSMKNRRID